MKVVQRDCPGHFNQPERLGFFLHLDIVPDKKSDPHNDTIYCVSCIGEYALAHQFLNGPGTTYEVFVFHKTSDDPWSEIKTFYTNDKVEAVFKTREFVKEYSRIAEEEV